MMNNRMGAAVTSSCLSGPGGSSIPTPTNTNMNPSMSPNMQPSPSHLNNPLGSPHQPGLGVKPGAQTPPANVLQVVKQVKIRDCLNVLTRLQLHHLCSRKKIILMVHRSYKFIVLGSGRSCETTSAACYRFWKSDTNWRW